MKEGVKCVRGEINVAFVTVEEVCNQVHLMNSTVTFSVHIQCASGALPYHWQAVCMYMPGGKSILLSLWIPFIFGFSSHSGMKCI